MNRQQLLNYIQSPELLDQESLPVLKAFAEDYPYCQTAHILLAGNMFNLDHVQFHQQLKCAAAYASDREKLYYLFNKKPLPADELSDLITPIYKIEEVFASEQEVPLMADHDPATAKKEEDIQIGFSSKLQDDQSRSIVSHDEKRRKIMEAVSRRLSDAGKITPPKDTWVSQDEIVERFIRKQPRILPRKELEENKEDLSEKSTIERDDFISETLARIYARQGDYVKAVNIYEKLSLKNPEKSSYFAAQIEKIKNQNI